MADGPVRKAAKVFEVRPGTIGDAWDQRVPAGAKKPGRQDAARPKGLSIEEVLQEALRNPEATVQGKKYTAPLDAILRQQVFSETGPKRLQAIAAYRSLSPRERQQVDAIIVAANPNAQGGPGISPAARELIEALGGAPMSRQREQAVLDAALQEGYSAERKLADASPDTTAPDDIMPPGADPDAERARIRERVVKQLKDEGRYSGPGRGALREKMVSEEFEKAQQDAPRQRPFNEPDKNRARFSPRGSEMVSVPLEGLEAPPISEASLAQAKQNFPAWYESQRENYRRQLQAVTASRSGKPRKRAALPDKSPGSLEEIRADLIRARDAKRAQMASQVAKQTADMEGLPDDEIAKRLVIDPAEFPGLERYREQLVNQKYPDYRTNPNLLDKAADDRLQISRFLQSPEGIEEAVNRRFPPLRSEADVEAKVREIWQGAHEQATFGRVPPGGYSLPVDDSAAIAAGRKQEQINAIVDKARVASRKQQKGEPLSDEERQALAVVSSGRLPRLSQGERQALSGYEPSTSMTRRDRGEIAPMQTYVENFTKTLGYDPWMTPEEFNTSRSMGRPSTKPGNIPGVGQNRTRQPSVDDQIGRDDSAAFDEAWDETAQTKMEGVQSGSRLARDEQAEELAKMEGIETSPLKSKKGRGASAGRINSLSKSSLENLYTEMLRAAGVEKSVRDAGGTTKDLKGAFLKPPAAHGFTDPDEMADFAIRILDKAKPVPPALKESVKEQLRDIFVSRWGQDLGMASLPKAGGKPVAAGDSAADILRGRLNGTVAAPAAPSAPAPKPAETLDPRWSDEDYQQKKRIEAAQRRAEELDREVEAWPEGVESMETPAAADELMRGLDEEFGGANLENADFINQAKSLFGEAPSQKPTAASPAAQKPRQTQVGLPDGDVVQTRARGQDPDEALVDVTASAGPSPDEEADYLRQRLQGGMEPDESVEAPAQPPAKPPVGPPKGPSRPGTASQGSDPLGQYVSEAQRLAKILAETPENTPKFQGAVASYMEMRRQLKGLQETAGAESIATRWNADVIGPMDAALKGRFPGGMPTPPSRPATLDPLESAPTTPVGEADGPAVQTQTPAPAATPTPPGPTAAPTPPPVPPAGPSVTPPPVPPSMDQVRQQVRNTREQMARAIQVFRARNGREPNMEERKAMLEALKSGRIEDGPLQRWVDEETDFSHTAKEDLQDAARTRQQIEIDAVNRQLRGQSKLDELPLPGKSGRSAVPERAAQDAEEAASKVDAAKVTKDAESDKATAVAAKAASDADTEAAAKRVEDASNASTTPQPQKAGQSGKPSLPVRALKAAGSEVGQIVRGGWPHLAKRGVQATGALGSMAWRQGPLLALGAYGAYANRDAIKRALPPGWSGTVDAAAEGLEGIADAARSGASSAAAAAAAAMSEQGEVPVGNGPGGQGGAGGPFVPVGFGGPGDGPMMQDGAINMVPPTSPGYSTDESLDRIRRIISGNEPKSRYRPGTAQRPYTYY